MRPLYKETDFEPPPSQAEPRPPSRGVTLTKLTIAALLLACTVWLILRVGPTSENATLQRLQAQELRNQQDLSERYPDTSPSQPQPGTPQPPIHVVH